MDDKADDHTKAFSENSDAASANESQFVTPRLRTKSSRKKRRRRSLMHAASKKVPPGLPPPPAPKVETSAPATTEPCAHTDENATATRESLTHVRSEATDPPDASTCPLLAPHALLSGSTTSIAELDRRRSRSKSVGFMPGTTRSLLVPPEDLAGFGIGELPPPHALLSSLSVLPKEVRSPLCGDAVVVTKFRKDKLKRGIRNAKRREHGHLSANRAPFSRTEFLNIQKIVRRI
ncbi:uncharacterized protein LOC142571167 [Dermacentor variabilis]|uniref:uncharacterized protein LOC142571167 n=1 Tax=Dermacentor variabilis TaxID=34621 RepID=UPI003F5C79B6